MESLKKIGNANSDEKHRKENAPPFSMRRFMDGFDIAKGSAKDFDTYVKTAINRLSSRILMNNIWKARRTCVAVASGWTVPVSFEIRPT